MRAQDYIFADVRGIDIGGEVLPQHDVQGAWRPERAEDWAFLAEAWGERSLVEYLDSSTARTQAEIDEKKAEIGGQRFMRNLRVADMTSAWQMFEAVERLLDKGQQRWCAGAPAERTWDDNGQVFDWRDCAEMFPARQLHVGAVPETKDYLWEVDGLRAAFADLAANEAYVCSYWYDAATQKSHFETNTGMSEEMSGFAADYGKSETMGDVAWWRTVPRAPTLTLPQGAGTPTLAALFHAQGSNAGVDKWYLKRLAPDGITAQLLESMLPQMSGSGDSVSVALVDMRLIVPIDLRTKLN